MGGWEGERLMVNFSNIFYAEDPSFTALAYIASLLLRHSVFFICYSA